MQVLKEFRDFAVRGNVVDMAVGIIIGGAFGRIVTSLVNDIIMPPIGYALGNVDFSELAIVLREATDETPAVTIGYGLFLNTLINFLIVAFAIFLVIKQLNRLKKQPPPAPPSTRPCPFCQSDIAIKAVRCPHCTSQIESA
jgi:large conductance mechanosensitive channel